MRFFEIARHFFEKERGLSLLEQVSVEDLQLFQIWLAPARECGPISKEPWIDTTVAHYCKTLKSVFNKASRIERIAKNPAQFWSIPGGESAARRPMKREEFELICSVAPSWFVPVLRALWLTGARGASIAALRWCDVDAANDRLFIASRKGKRKTVKIVAIPLLPELKIIINSYFLKPGQIITPDGRIFTDDSGTPITAQQISTLGHQSIKRAGIEGVTLYGLRHALATDLLESGASPDVIRRMLGHSNINQQQSYQKFASLKPIEEALKKVREKSPPLATADDTETKNSDEDR